MNSIGLRLASVVAIAAALLQAGDGFAREPDAATTLDSRTRAALISEINELLIDQYIFLDVAQELKRHLDSRLEAGAYDAMVDPHRLAALLRQDLYDVSQDSHFHLEFNPERGQATELIGLHDDGTRDPSRRAR
jgi:hypothetical protein